MKKKIIDLIKTLLILWAIPFVVTGLIIIMLAPFVFVMNLLVN